MRTLTESELYTFQERMSSGLACGYQMTEAELGWLDFVRGKYSIADYLDERMQDGGMVALDDELSQALDDDCQGFGKAVCLADDTDLQAIFFYCYTETEYNEEG